MFSFIQDRIYLKKARDNIQNLLVSTAKLSTLHKLLLQNWTTTNWKRAVLSSWLKIASLIHGLTVKQKNTTNNSKDPFDCCQHKAKDQQCKVDNTSHNSQKENQATNGLRESKRKTQNCKIYNFIVVLYVPRSVISKRELWTRIGKKVISILLVAVISKTVLALVSAIKWAKQPAKLNNVWRCFLAYRHLSLARNLSLVKNLSLARNLSLGGISNRVLTFISLISLKSPVLLGILVGASMLVVLRCVHGRVFGCLLN